MTRSSNPLPVDAIRAQARQHLAALLEPPLTGAGKLAIHHQVRHALECLPLTTAEFATAVNRLENARAYLEVGEPGAARFELLLLLRSLEPEPTPSDE
jgi:hypothetical protein